MKRTAFLSIRRAVPVLVWDRRDDGVLSKNQGFPPPAIAERDSVASMDSKEFGPFAKFSAPSKLGNFQSRLAGKERLNNTRRVCQSDSY
jgi:hypothetical protein